MVTTDAGTNAPAKVHGYITLLEMKEAAVRVLINDWPVVDRETSGQDEILLNPFVVEGKNVLRVQVGPIDEPGDRYVYADLYRAEPHQDTSDRKLIYSVRWTPFVGGYSKNDYIDVARHEIFARKAFGRWRWEDARLFRIEDEPAARARVLALHRALETKDVDGFIAMSSIKLEELARASGRHPAAVTEVQRELLRGYLDDPQTSLLPLDVNDVQFRSGAGGRLVEARMPDGTAPLSLEIQGGNIELRVVLSHLDSGLELVR